MTDRLKSERQQKGGDRIINLSQKHRSIAQGLLLTAPPGSFCWVGVYACARVWVSCAVAINISCLLVAKSLRLMI